MVRILSTGEIVGDNDPRSRQGADSSERQRRNIGRIQHDPDAMAQQYEGGGGGGGGGGWGGAGGGGGEGGGQQFSIFDGLNERLLGYGFPRFNVGSHTVEPIVSVGFILAGLLLGLPGILLGLVLFFFSKMSSSGGGLGSFFGGGDQGQGGNRSSGNRSSGNGSRVPRGGGNSDFRSVTRKTT